MEEAGPAGVDSNLLFENSDNMMELPVIKYDQKQVGIQLVDHRVTLHGIVLERMTLSKEKEVVLKAPGDMSISIEGNLFQPAN